MGIPAEIRNLSVEDRLTLVKEICDSIAEDSVGNVDLSDAQMDEIERRREDLLTGRVTGMSWEQVRSGIKL